MHGMLPAQAATDNVLRPAKRLFLATYWLGQVGSITQNRPKPTSPAAAGQLNCLMDSVQTKPHYSLPSIIALVAAIASFFVSAGTGFLLAIVAIACGVLGFILSLSPSIRGGFISVLSLCFAGLGIIVAVIRAIVRL